MMIDLGDLQLPPEFFNKQSQDDHKKLMLLLTKVSGMRYLDFCRLLNNPPELDWCKHDGKCVAMELANMNTRS